MKRILFVFALLANSYISMAQQYIVFSVAGNIVEKKASFQNKILPKSLLNENCYICVPKLSRIVIINKTSQEMYTINGTSEGTIKQLLKGEHSATKKLSPQYLTILLNKLSKGNTRNTYMQSAATSFRDGDKIVEKLDSLNSDSISVNQ